MTNETQYPQEQSGHYPSDETGQHRYNHPGHHPHNQPVHTVYVQQQNQTNGVGTAGFVIALVALFLGWIPFLGWVLWLLGLVLSAVGMTRKPKGLAIAGLVISLIGIILLIVVFGTLLGGAIAFL